jgi:hypothetical protein
MRAARDLNGETDSMVCGCIVADTRGDEVDLVCNECDALIRPVPAAETEQALAQLALSEEICSEICTYCGALKVFSGFSSIEALSTRNAAKA